MKSAKLCKPAISLNPLFVISQLTKQELFLKKRIIIAKSALISRLDAVHNTIPEPSGYAECMWLDAIMCSKRRRQQYPFLLK